MASVQTLMSSSPSSVASFSASNVQSPSQESSCLSGMPGIDIPDHWQPEVESRILSKHLTDNARAEIKRTLVNQLFARSSKPDRSDCEQIARKLILMYPFMNDDLGNGYVSCLKVSMYH